MLLLIDFGSTYTKLTAVDLKKLEIAGTADSITTVDTDIMEGFNKAFKILKRKIGNDIRFEEKLASSSAAGGLRMVAVGLVPELTAEAARLAALKAGAKVVGVFSCKLSESDLDTIENLSPDIILLAGGTDGGNKECIIHNAGTLGRLQLDVPIVFAGNSYAACEAEVILTSFGKEVYVTDNVLPNLKELNVEPAREIIRKIFINRIIYAKGIDKAQEFIDEIIMPTPAAVLEAAKLLADGICEEEGLGDLIVVDVGGATTDIHSINKGLSSDPNVIYKGLPQPYAKRTVEGDLGVRYNAPNLITMVEESELEEIKPCFDISAWVEHLNKSVGVLPDTKEKALLDQIMTRKAVEVAVGRHAGTLETVNMPGLTRIFQRGKDLTDIKYVIGTGGPIIYSENPLEILKGCLLKEKERGLLKPINPKFLVDKKYILASMGLIADKYPLEALKIMKKYLK
ncbi:MAG TPA: MutL protein [Thermoanaerobacterales bacterium]|nr:MutL protein [Thermoanaerobacterales bacterium]